MHPILHEIQNLPPQAQQQAIAYLTNLLQQYQHRPQRYLQQDWAGAMSAYREQYTSLSLQQETVDDWSRDVSD
ncbi:hypothetical protein XM38_044510 [Halomicronema hongdechloris C2206]|uniref:DUF2281 domain-containing protein n=1 Tax=Halomicronema hongdechloris C2206 TaxID=1641165 RepID=A0A1Z3HT60_9CYAN|nr:DUF2281 domain-containing protein [Halomicronema hongdechloris]ASC73484.1 hypothetical protein XM38_044510 [Halomicronema hongdechloris C2206]